MSTNSLKIYAIGYSYLSDLEAHGSGRIFIETDFLISHIKHLRLIESKLLNYFSHAKVIITAWQLVPKSFLINSSALLRIYQNEIED